MASPSDGYVCADQLPDVPEYQLLCKEGCYLFHKEDAVQCEADRLKVAEYKRLDETCAMVLNNLFEAEKSLDEAEAERIRAEQALAQEVASQRVVTWSAFGLGVLVTIGVWFVSGEVR